MNNYKEQYNSKIGTFKLIYDSVNISYNTILCENKADNTIDFYTMDCEKILTVGDKADYRLYHKYNMSNSLNEKIIQLSIKNNKNSVVPDLTDVVLYNAQECKIMKFNKDLRLPRSFDLSNSFSAFYDSNILVISDRYYGRIFYVFRLNGEILDYICEVDSAGTLAVWTDIKVTSNIYEEGAGLIDIIEYNKYYRMKQPTGFQTVLKHESTEVVDNLRLVSNKLDSNVRLKCISKGYSYSYILSRDHMELNRDIIINDLGKQINGYVQIISSSGIGLIKSDGELVVEPVYDSIVTLNKDFILINHKKQIGGENNFKFSILHRDILYEFDCSNITFTIPKLYIICISINNVSYYINMKYNDISDDFNKLINKYYLIYINNKYKSTYMYKDKYGSDNVIINKNFIEVSSEYHKELNKEGWNILRM